MVGGLSLIAIFQYFIASFLIRFRLNDFIYKTLFCSFIPRIYSPPRMSLIYFSKARIASLTFSTLVISRPYSAICTVPPIDTWGFRYSILPST